MFNELKKHLKDELKIKQFHGKPMHPKTQGKTERYHSTMKNVVKLNPFYQEELIETLEQFVNNYSNNLCHKALNNRCLLWENQ